MARRRGGGGAAMTPDPVGNPDGLGVGALAAGELQHGERPIVEGLARTARQASSPNSQGGMQPTQSGGPIPGANVDPWAPTSRPDEPITAGLPGGPGGPAPLLADDPDSALRALYEAWPHPDIAALLDSRGF